jgi:hypothetical protein
VVASEDSGYLCAQLLITTEGGVYFIAHRQSETIAKGHCTWVPSLLPVPARRKFGSASSMRWEMAPPMQQPKAGFDHLAKSSGILLHHALSQLRAGC